MPIYDTVKIVRAALTCGYDVLAAAASDGAVSDALAAAADVPIQTPSTSEERQTEFFTQPPEVLSLAGVVSRDGVALSSQKDLASASAETPGA